MTIATLQFHGICTSSFSRAVQEFTARDLSIARVNEFIREMAPTAQLIEDLQTATYVAAYLVQDVVQKQAHEPADSATLAAALEHAQKLTEQSNNRVVFTSSDITKVETDPDTGEERLVVIKRGPGRSKTSDGETAQEKAKKLFDANPTLSRKDMIDKFVEDLGISVNTGSTYFALFNKDVKRVTGGKKGKRAGESRDEQVQRVFASRTEWTDRKELVNAIVAETGCSAASANTFSYKVMPSTGRKKGPSKPIMAPEVKKTAAAVIDGLKDKKAEKGTSAAKAKTTAKPAKKTTKKAAKAA